MTGMTGMPGMNDLLDERRRIVELHQGRADEDGIGHTAYVPHVVRGEITALGDDDPIVGNFGEKPGCEVAIDLEGVEVAIVDTDDGAFDVESTFDLARVVALDERCEAELARGVRELGELDRRQASHDEKHRTRSEIRRFAYLSGIDDEILHEHRKGDGLGRGFEVVVGAFKARRLGEHAECSRSCFLIAADLLGQTTLRDVAETRALLLVLRDDIELRLSSNRFDEARALGPSFWHTLGKLPGALACASDELVDMSRESHQLFPFSAFPGAPAASR